MNEQLKKMKNYIVGKSILARSICLLCAVGILSVCDAQSDISSTIKNQFNNFQQKNLHEKIFIHTDRSSYVAGEIIWFKVYCLDAASNKLSELSKVAYVEVLDKDLQPVLQGKIWLKDGTGSGSFAIPASLASGNFLLRSYTNWMKNFDPEFYYHQNLTIINTTRSENQPAAKPVNNYDIQFFPEGGNLVAGIKSNVAYRAIDNTGKGINFTGFIADQNNDTILHFHPSKFGIGRVSFIPSAGKQYKAFIKTNNGDETAVNLPAALSTGFVLNAENGENNRSIKINIKTNTNDRNALVMIHSQQEIIISQQVALTNGAAELEIEKSKLKDGISTITLFNENSQPVCERLYFKKPQQHLVINASADNSQYALRKKVTIQVTAKEESQLSAASEMSMAVYRLDSLPAKNENIYQYIWLLSELKGGIESPEYYFDNNGEEVDASLDNLMLTHGWRRYKWDEILKNTAPKLTYLPEIEGHIVSARIVSKINEAPGGDVSGFLSVPGAAFQLYSAKSKKDGNIYFNTHQFFGPNLIVGQTNKEAASFRLDFSNPFSESYSSLKIPAFNNSNSISPSLLKRSIQMQVENIFSGEKLNLLHAALVDTTHFYGKPDAKYMLEDYTRFPTMEEVLREYVREVNVKKRRNEFILTTVIKDENGNPEVNEPVVLLDGVPQFDKGNRISHYDPLKVKELEIVQEKYLLGPVTFDGIVSFSTYNGDLEGFRLDTTSTVIDYEGLQLKREFYSPLYETAQQVSSRLPDFRSLLFWSPDVNTNESGQKEVSFYTSDVAGRYAVVLQGISKNGNAGSKVMTIDVKK